MPVTIDSLGNVYDGEQQLPKYSTPTESDRRQAAAFLNVMRNEPIGQWADNPWKQAQHLDGIIYVAIRAIRNLAGGASYHVYRRNRPDRQRTTFGPGNVVVKALSSPQMAGRDEDYTPFDDDDHPLCHIISHPNPTETFGELSAKLVMQNRLTGVGPLWTIPNEKHKPVELWPLQTPTIYPIRQFSMQYPKGAWRVMPMPTMGWGVMPSGMGAAGAIIPGEEVKRWMEPHPYRPWDGYSPLTAGAKQLDVLTSIDEARLTAMNDGLVLDTYMVIPGADQAALDAAVAKMKELGAGSKKHRAFRAFATENPESKATIQTVNARVVDMDFPEGWEQMTKFCLALFGVPPSVAGLNAAGSYSEHYAARQQFVDEQADYLESLATFYTKSLAWPWCTSPGEFLIRVKPRPINDHELQEKQHTRQCQVGTVTLDESRKKDDLPPWEDPEIGKLPVQIALAVIQQNAMPQPQPGMPGAPPDAAAGPDAGAADEMGTPGAEQPTDAAGLQDAITTQALATLGVPGDDEEQPAAPLPVQKAFGGARGRFDESKHKRDHGKFSSTGGSGATPSTPAHPPAGKPVDTSWGAGYAAAYPPKGPTPAPSLAGGARPTPPPLPGAGPKQVAWKPGVEPPPKSPAEHKERIAKAAPGVAKMAGNIPEGADVLASAKRWAGAAADKHADRVAQHLGISPQEAHHLIRTTIEHLCHVAANINKTGASQKTVRGASGKTLKFRIGGAGKQTQSGADKMPNRGTGGGPPRPRNPMGKGSRPPIPGGARKAMDAMSTLDDSAGGFLVEPKPASKRKSGKRRLRSLVQKALEGLGE